MKYIKSKSKSVCLSVFGEEFDLTVERAICFVTIFMHGLSGLDIIVVAGRRRELSSDYGIT